jgi:peptide/nickel transport system substrate-binding protein
MSVFRKAILAATCVGSLVAVAAPALAETTLRVVMHSDLKILDPIWTTAYIVRNHGYMIYDTLLAQDEKGEVKPQMVEKYEAAADGKGYTFTLRDGLLWHDGQPVTSEDCIASIKRWAAKDSLGQKMMTFVDTISAVDAKTFTIKLKEPTGLVLLGLSKPSSNVPFMMPKRVAETDPNKQIEDFTGSGPFVFKKDEWKPGDKTVYVKFDKYKPRSEPPSSVSGGKVVKVDRVEWRAISDAQQAINALQKGEIDMVEQPSHDLLGPLKKDTNIEVVISPMAKLQYVFRPNHLHKPFDNPKIRQALWYAFNQEDFLMATIGDENYIKVCKALFICDTPFGSTQGTDAILNSNMKKAQELLKEAGYDGTPVLLMHSTDLKSLTNLAPVAKSLMEKAGFKVDMQSMDWQTLVARRAKKDPPSAGGWNAFLTAWVAADVMNPVSTGYLNSSCDKALFGWPCDETMEKLRDDFARALDPAKQKEIADAVQQRNIEITAEIPVGEYVSPLALRKNVKGLVFAPAPVFWNIELTK